MYVLSPDNELTFLSEFLADAEDELGSKRCRGQNRDERIERR
jgi:hypothetical protein